MSHSYSPCVKFLLPQKVLTFCLNNCSRIDGNSISGKIPSFIKNWQSVNRMLVHSDIKHLMTFSWSESERPSFTQISILTLSLHFPAICRVHRWVDLFLQKFPCWRTWQNCMIHFTCCIVVLLHFFILYWSLVLKEDCDWPKVMHHQEGDWFEWTKHEISSLTKCTAPYGSVSLCFCDFNQATL